MTKPTFKEITDSEFQWIESQLKAGRSFVIQYTSADADLTLEALDEAWAAWMTTEEPSTDEVNHAINSIGIPFGSLLVETGEFAWCIASDEWGTDLAVRALPGRGDVLAYPADFVSKRWESKASHFLVGAFSQITNHVARVKRDWNSNATPS